jgi:hypothetical protein
MLVSACSSIRQRGEEQIIHPPFVHYAEHVAQQVYIMLPWSGLFTAACMHMHPTPPASTLESSMRGRQGQGKEGVGRGQLVLVSIDSALQVGAPLFRK